MEIINRICIDTVELILIQEIITGIKNCGKAKPEQAGNIYLSGPDLLINGRNGGVMVNKSNVTATDIEATNGVIPVIDAVLISKETKKAH